MRSRCECVVKRTGKVCVKPTTAFNSQGTPVCGLHTGQPRRRRTLLVNRPHHLLQEEEQQQPTLLDPFVRIKKEYIPNPPPPPPPPLLKKQHQSTLLDPFVRIKKEDPSSIKTNNVSTQTEVDQRRFPTKRSVLSVLQWIVVLFSMLLVLSSSTEPPPQQPTSWTQKMLECVLH